MPLGHNSGNDAGAVGRLADMRETVRGKVAARATIYRASGFINYSDEDAAVDELASDLIARLTLPAEPSEICAKLRRQDLFDLHGSTALVNPDGPAAAAIIERLTASLVEVRDALAQCYIEKQSADGDPRLQRADEALAMTKGGGNVG